MELTVRLPRELVQEATEFGLLAEDKLATLLRSEVDRRVMDLVNAEIQAHRKDEASRGHNEPHDAE